MRKECQSIDHTTHHPHIYFVSNLVLQIRIHDLWRPIHRSSHRLNLLLKIAVFCLADLLKIYESIRTGPEITQFESFVLTDKNILYLDVLMIHTNLVDIFQTLEDRVCDCDELFLAETFVFSCLEEIKESTVGAVFHEDHKYFVLYISVSESYYLPAKAAYNVLAFWKFHLHINTYTISSNSVLAS